MAAPRRNKAYELMWKVHRWVWRVSGGRIGRRVVGMPVLQLTTTGRKSGEPRSVLLSYLEHADGYVVVASNAGDQRYPLWWLNLEANSRAVVGERSGETAVTAEEVEGEERAVLWERLVAANSGYADYANHTDRDIPVVLLRPVT